MLSLTKLLDFDQIPFIMGGEGWLAMKPQLSCFMIFLWPPYLSMFLDHAIYEQPQYLLLNCFKLCFKSELKIRLTLKTFVATSINKTDSCDEMFAVYWVTYQQYQMSMGQLWAAQMFSNTILHSSPIMMFFWVFYSIILSPN